MNLAPKTGNQQEGSRKKKRYGEQGIYHLCSRAFLGFGFQRTVHYVVKEASGFGRGHGRCAVCVRNQNSTRDRWILQRKRKRSLLLDKASTARGSERPRSEIVLPMSRDEHLESEAIVGLASEYRRHEVMYATSV